MVRVGDDGRIIREPSVRNSSQIPLSPIYTMARIGDDGRIIREPSVRNSSQIPPSSTYRVHRSSRWVKPCGLLLIVTLALLFWKIPHLTAYGLGGVVVFIAGFVLISLATPSLLAIIWKVANWTIRKTLYIIQRIILLIAALSQLVERLSFGIFGLFFPKIIHSVFRFSWVDQHPDLSLILGILAGILCARYCWGLHQKLCSHLGWRFNFNGQVGLLQTLLGQLVCVWIPDFINWLRYAIYLKLRWILWDGWTIPFKRWAGIKRLGAFLTALGLLGGVVYYCDIDKVQWNNDKRVIRFGNFAHAFFTSPTEMWSDDHAEIIVSIPALKMISKTYELGKPRAVDIANRFVSPPEPPESIRTFSELVETGSPAEVIAAIKRGANVNVKGQYDLTPLHLLANLSQNLEIFTALISAGADVNAKLSNGFTPLHCALSNNQNQKPEFITALISAGADVNAKAFLDWAPLHAAANCWSNGKISEIIAILVKAGADVNAKTDRGDTPLQKGLTPLHIAAMGNERNHKTIEALVEAGADVNAKDDSGDTPLDLAINNNKNNLAKVLLAMGARKGKEYTGDFFVLVETGSPAEVVDAIKRGANVNAKIEKSGYTPLHFAAAKNQNPDVITTLGKAGGSVNAQNNDGNTPLHLAARSNQNPEIITALVNAGANINTKNYANLTPLEVARLAKKDSNARRLRDLGTGGKQPPVVATRYEDKLADIIRNIVENQNFNIGQSATLKLTMMPQSGRAFGCEIKKSTSSNPNLDALCDTLVTYFGKNPLPDATQSSTFTAFAVNFSGAATPTVTRLQPEPPREQVITRTAAPYGVVEHDYVSSPERDKSQKRDDNSERNRKIKKGAGIAAGIGLAIIGEALKK